MSPTKVSFQTLEGNPETFTTVLVPCQISGMKEAEDILLATGPIRQNRDYLSDLESLSIDSLRIPCVGERCGRNPCGKLIEIQSEVVASQATVRHIIAHAQVEP